MASLFHRVAIISMEDQDQVLVCEVSPDGSRL